VFLAKTGISGIPVESSADALPEGQKRFVEAARAILMGTNLAIFDEPMSGLDSDETIRMTALIKRMKDDGVQVILISHDIPLVLDICDRVTVLKEGRRVGALEARETTCGEISRMIGEPASAFPSRTEASGDIVLSLPQAGIELRAGEIVGIEAPGGNLKTGIIRTIFGADPRNRGDYSIFGFKMRTGPPGGAIKHRIGLSSDERKLRNSALYLTIRKKTAYARVEHNPISIGGESPFAGMPGFGGKSGPRGETAATTQNLFEPSEALEGRIPGDLMLGNVEVVIFDEPSRGADEAAKTEIYKLMNELASRRKGIIMFSLDKRELDGMCGRTAQIR
jgi:ribose transport system ATP-binding protein